MVMQEFQRPADPRLARIQGLIDLFLRSLSLVFLLLGLMHWAIIIGAFPDPQWRFEAMGIEWQLVTMNLAVADLVAGVGLWMRVAWGNVTWIYAALFETAMHTLFRGTFGANWLIVAFHLLTLLVFVALTVAERRARPHR